MAKKKIEASTTTINFRCPADIADGLKTLVFISDYDNLSELLIEMCRKLVSANRQQIANIEQSRTRNQMREPTYEITASRRKLMDASAPLKGGDANENA